MWYEVLQSDLIPINYMKQGERISIVQKKSYRTKCVDKNRLQP